MNDNDNMAGLFVKSAADLYNANKKLFSNSFNKEIIRENIDLIKQKRYAIVDSIWKINKKENQKFLLSLLKLLNENTPEYKDDIKKILNAFKDEKISGDFILNILQNRQKSLYNFVREQNLSNDFITFYSIFAAYKYRNSVMYFIKEAYDFSSHLSGLCPVCGHWPGMAYIMGEKGTRILACICCGAEWQTKRMMCSFCLTRNKEHLSYLNVDGEEEISAYTCENCRRYIKTVKIDSDEVDLSDEKPLIDYMNSGFIDIAAMQNKYVQESLLMTKFIGPEDEHLEKYIKMLINE